MSVAKSSPPEGIPLTDCERHLWLDIAWADQNEEVRAKYAGQWVAVYECRVLAHGQDREQVLCAAAALVNRPKEELAIWPVSNDDLLTDAPSSAAEI